MAQASSMSKRIRLLSGDAIDIPMHATSDILSLREAASQVLKVPVGRIQFFHQQNVATSEDIQSDDLHVICLGSGSLVVVPWFQAPYHLDCVSGMRYTLGDDPYEAHRFCVGDQCIYVWDKTHVHQVHVLSGRTLRSLRLNVDPHFLHWRNGYLYVAHAYAVDCHVLPEPDENGSVANPNPHTRDQSQTSVANPNPHTRDQSQTSVANPNPHTRDQSQTSVAKRRGGLVSIRTSESEENVSLDTDQMIRIFMAREHPFVQRRRASRNRSRNDSADKSQSEETDANSEGEPEKDSHHRSNTACDTDTQAETNTRDTDTHTETGARDTDTHTETGARDTDTHTETGARDTDTHTETDARDTHTHHELSQDTDTHHELSQDVAHHELSQDADDSAADSDDDAQSRDAFLSKWGRKRRRESIDKSTIVSESDLYLNVSRMNSSSTFSVLSNDLEPDCTSCASQCKVGDASEELLGQDETDAAPEQPFAIPSFTLLGGREDICVECLCAVDDSIYVGYRSGSVKQFSLQSHEVVHTFIGSQLGHLRAIATTKVFNSDGSSSEGIACLTPGDCKLNLTVYHRGELSRHTVMDTSWTSCMTTHEDRIYFGTLNGQCGCYRLHPFKHLWTYDGSDSQQTFRRMVVSTCGSFVFLGSDTEVLELSTHGGGFLRAWRETGGVKELCIIRP